MPPASGPVERRFRAHWNVTAPASGTKIVSGMPGNIALACCGASVTHANGMGFPAAISENNCLKKFVNPSLRSIVNTRLAFLGPGNLLAASHADLGPVERRVRRRLVS